MHSPCVTTLIARANNAPGTASSRHCQFGLEEEAVNDGVVGSVRSVMEGDEAYPKNEVLRLGYIGMKNGRERKCCGQQEGQHLTL